MILTGRQTERLGEMLIKIVFVDGHQVVEIDAPTLAGVNLDDFSLHRALLENQNLSGASFKGGRLKGGVSYFCCYVRLQL